MFDLNLHEMSVLYGLNDGVRHPETLLLGLSFHLMYISYMREKVQKKSFWCWIKFAQFYIIYTMCFIINQLTPTNAQ
jgi:hypothetical protein